MKSLRKAIRGNQAYHSNLLGKEFDELVADATEKGLAQPNEEANRNVVPAHIPHLSANAVWFV